MSFILLLLAVWAFYVGNTLFGILLLGLALYFDN